MIDAGLAADGGIDLGQQGGGDLDEGDAALVAGGGKAGHVADHAAAQGDQGAVPTEAAPQEAVEDAVQTSRVLNRSPSGRTAVWTGEPGERRLDRLQIERGDGLVGDDHDLATPDMGPIEVGGREEAGPM